MHDHNFIHWDVKLDNILYCSKENQAKLTDFTVSRQLASTDEWMHNCEGTPSFTAPETYISEAEGYKPRPTDIWSIGVSLYTYITEIVPFYAQSELEMQMNAKNKEPFMHDYFPEDLKDILTLMLSKDPEKRPTATQALSHKFFN